MLNNWNIFFWEYEFHAPAWLLLLLLIPFVLWALFRAEQNSTGEVKYTGSDQQQQFLSDNWIVQLRKTIIICYGLITALLILAIAKPFHLEMDEDNTMNYKDGIDIVIAMDISGSMLAQDFKPNRLEVSKRVAKEFISNRKGDRIGLVAYAGEAYTACPLTLDYEVLKNQIDAVNGERIKRGTAIGVGLGTALTRLNNDSIESKVIILLTDGVDGGAQLDPLTAAELAREMGVRVYTIGVGSNGEVPTLINSPFGSYYASTETEIDEDILREIASRTNGRYFRAKDEKTLKEIYKEIEKLEKRKIENSAFNPIRPIHPQGFLNWAFILLCIIWCLRYILFNRNE